MISAKGYMKLQGVIQNYSYTTWGHLVYDEEIKVEYSQLPYPMRLRDLCTMLYRSKTPRKELYYLRFLMCDTHHTLRYQAVDDCIANGFPYLHTLRNKT